MAFSILLTILSSLLLFNTNPITSLDISIGGGGGISIGIGGGGGGNDNNNGGSSPINCPPPQPNSVPSSPPPMVFPSLRVKQVFPVIQRFKNILTCDPMGIANSWTGADICNQYKGFFCEAPPDDNSTIAVASVDFNGYQLCAPSLDGFLDQLPDIALFHANSNNFTGTISPQIAKLRYLYELDLSNNLFTGPFPSSLLAATNITFLDLRYNAFSGSVPPQVFSLNLEVLFINNNKFVTKLPDNFGLTPVLYLTLANNKFTGQIPRSLGTALRLREVLFLGNQLCGCLPYEIGHLKSLTLFDVGNNQLTGPIPCSFGCLDNVQQINLAGNLFYGMVPEVVCALGNLGNLSLSNNYFTHVGPICRNLIRTGVLDVRKNCIHYLPGQRSFAECAMFFSRPRYCPYMASFNFIPCKLPQSLIAAAVAPMWMMTRKQPYSPIAPSPTYAALNKHRV